MPHDIFISYSHRDKPIADAVCANLESGGFRCWIAPRDITPGQDWPTAISDAIAASRVMVLVFSASSNSSKDVSRELILAANNDLIIIPFKIDNIAPEAGKQYYLARTHWLDAMNPPTQDQIDTLVKYARSFLSEHMTPISTRPEMATQAPAAEVFQPATKVEAPPFLPEKGRPERGQKGTRGKSIWAWSILFVAVIIGGGAFAIRPFKQVPTPTITYAPTLISTIPSTPTISPTPLPRLTSTKTLPPGWVTEFAQPILDAIADRPPSFQDDFGSGSAGWIADRCGQRIAYVDGELVLTDCIVNHANIDYADFVVEFDAHFLPETVMNNASNWSVVFRQYDTSGYRYSIYYDGRITLSLAQNKYQEFSNAAFYPLGTNHILLIAKGSKFAFYINNRPLYFSEESSVIRQGSMTLQCSDGSGARDLAHPAIVGFDNFKIWNIYDLP